MLLQAGINCRISRAPRIDYPDTETPSAHCELVSADENVIKQWAYHGDSWASLWKRLGQQLVSVLTYQNPASIEKLDCPLFDIPQLKPIVSNTQLTRATRRVP